MIDNQKAIIEDIREEKKIMQLYYEEKSEDYEKKIEEIQANHEQEKIKIIKDATAEYHKMKQELEILEVVNKQRGVQVETLQENLKTAH